MIEYGSVKLTHYLIEHLTRHGAVETLLMLVAACGFWAFTTFEVTPLDVERTDTKAVTVTVMGLGLFMNAGITQTFEDSPWLFVIPMLLSLAGPGIYAVATSPTPQLRQHFHRVLIWIRKARTPRRSGICDVLRSPCVVLRVPHLTLSSRDPPS